MRRRYTTARFADRIAAVRALMPDAFIGIDVIVGFPGETEEDFRTTYDFLAGLEPAFLHIFPFSGTSRHAGRGDARQGAGFGGDAPRGRAGGAVREAARGILRPCRGERGFRVVRKHAARGMMFGFTGNYRRVKAPYDKARVNTVCRVRLGAMDESHDLMGEIRD